MNLKDKVVVVTGGAGGIGRALCVRFKAEGAKAVVVADVQAAAAAQVAKEVGGVAIETNVARESDIQRLVKHLFGAPPTVDNELFGGQTATRLGGWETRWTKITSAG